MSSAVGALAVLLPRVRKWIRFLEEPLRLRPIVGEPSDQGRGLRHFELDQVPLGVAEDLHALDLVDPSVHADDVAIGVVAVIEEVAVALNGSLKDALGSGLTDHSLGS